MVIFPGDCCLSIADKFPQHERETILTLSDPNKILDIISDKFSEGGSKPSAYLVEPSRLDEGVWACFDNFLEGTKSGEPARGYLRNGHAADRLAHVLSQGDTDAGQEPQTVHL